MRVVYLIIVFHVLFGCSNRTYIGKYNAKFSTFELKGDSTFDYTFHLGWQMIKANGTWKYLQKNKFLINSLYDYNSLPITVKEKFDESGDLTFIIKPITNTHISFMDSIRYSIFVNEKEMLAKLDTLIKISKEPDLVFFKVKAYFPYENIRPYRIRKHLSTKTYHIKDLKSNFFEISFPLNSDMNYSEQIEHDTIEVKGNKLYWPNKGKSPFKKISN